MQESDSRLLLFSAGGLKQIAEVIRTLMRCESAMTRLTGGRKNLLVLNF